MSVVVVGINHRSVPLRILEAVTVSDGDLPKALHDLTNREHLSEAVVVSTCMRTEVYATVTRFHGAVGDIRTFLADWSGAPPEAMSDYIYDFYDDAAARHLLRVASGLDSAVLGEGEILRQVRSAWEVAHAQRAAGPTLGLLFRRAVETGKRVRSETAIARGTTSLSHTAVSLAGSVGVPLEAVPPEASACPVIGHGLPSGATAGPSPAPVSPGPESTSSADAGPRAFGSSPAVAGRTMGAVGADLPSSAGEASGSPCSWSDLLTDRTVLVVGAGEMGAAVATLLAGGRNAGPLLIANRTPARAEALASTLDAEVVAWDSLPTALGRADIVMVATASGEIVIDSDMVASATRPQRGQVIVDLSVPRNVEPAVAELPGVVLFDVTDLKAHAEAAMEGRRREIPAAEVIVTDELARLTRASTERGAAPVVSALRARGEAIRAAEVARLQARLGELDDRQRRAVDALSRGIVAKLLHEPTVNLKAAVGDPEGDRLIAAVEALFDL